MSEFDDIEKNDVNLSHCEKLDKNNDNPLVKDKNKKKFYCYLCKYKTTMSADWLKHINSKKHERQGKPKTKKCDKCDYEALTHWNLKQHKLTQHSTLEERSKSKYYCELCDLVFFCSAYKKKHEEGKRHKNLELCMKYQNELDEQERKEKINNV
jgi:hypothetical protein